MGILDHPSSSGSSQPVHHRKSSSSAPSGPGYFGIEWSKWFPPVTSRTFLSHYLPASGAISHTLYTVHLFSPNIISSIFPTGDLAVSNTILFNANVGLGFYVYFRRHLHRVNPWERVEFSVLSSTLFNFGSLLAAVLIRALFPSRTPTWLKSVTATVLSGYLLSRAAKYMGLLDHRTSGRGSVSPARSVLSPPRGHHLPISNNGIAHHNQKTSEGSRRPSSTASTPLHLDTTNGPITMTSSPPEQQLQYQPMTPSATEPSESDITSSEFHIQNPNNGNFRYLHSYALNNISSHQHQKNGNAILRRTTMNQKTSRHLNPNSEPQMSFVTPEPPHEAVYYTPPPSRLESRQKMPSEDTRRRRRIQKIQKKWDEDDKLDRFLDTVIDHAPFVVVPLALGCWYTGSVPIVGSTLRFIFA